MALTAMLTILPPRHRAVQAARPVCGWHWLMAEWQPEQIGYINAHGTFHPPERQL